MVIMEPAAAAGKCGETMVLRVRPWGVSRLECTRAKFQSTFEIIMIDVKLLTSLLGSADASKLGAGRERNCPWGALYIHEVLQAQSVSAQPPESAPSHQAAMEANCAFVNSTHNNMRFYKRIEYA